MIINHGAALRKAYFISYLHLVKNALDCSNDEAYHITFSRLFNNNADSLGNSSYRTFQEAFNQFDSNEKGHTES